MKDVQASTVRLTVGILAAAGLVCWTAACSAFPGGKPRAPKTAAAAHPARVSAPLSYSNALMADALAAYSEGVRQQMHGNFDAALTNFLNSLAYDPDNQELYLRIALEYIRRRDVPKAVATLQNLIRRKPRSADAHLWLGLVYRAAGNRQAAYQAYRRAMKLAPRRHAPYLEMASMLQREGKSDQAVALLRKGIKKVDDPTQLMRLLGEIYLRKAASSDNTGQAKENRLAAARAFEQALEHDPENVELLYRLADLYILTDQPAKAIPYFQRIEKIEPDNMDIKKKIALSFIAGGDRRKAVATLEKILTKEPDNPQINYYLGEIYEKLGDKQKARNHYQLATRATPPQPSAYIKLALLEMEDDPQEAVETLAKALKVLPDNVRITEMLAYLYLNQHDYHNALQYFSRAEQLLRNSPERSASPLFYFNYAIVAQRAGKIQQAADLLVDAAAEQPLLLDTYVQYIVQQDDEEVTEEAIQVLKKAAPELPDQPAVLIYLGMLQSFEHHYSEALQAFRQAEERIETLPADSPQRIRLDDSFYFLYGVASERTGHPTEAEEHFEKCIELNPKHADAYNYLAYMWAEKSVNLDKALKYIHKALEIEPDNGAFLDTLGWIYYMKGDYVQAQPQLERAWKQMSDDPTIAEHLGDLYDKLGLADKAAFYWKKSLQMDPSNTNLLARIRDRGIAFEPPAAATTNSAPDTGGTPADTNQAPPASSPAPAESGEDHPQTSPTETR